MYRSTTSTLICFPIFRAFLWVDKNIYSFKLLFVFKNFAITYAHLKKENICFNKSTVILKDWERLFSKPNMLVSWFATISSIAAHLRESFRYIDYRSEYNVLYLNILSVYVTRKFASEAKFPMLNERLLRY